MRMAAADEGLAGAAAAGDADAFALLVERHYDRIFRLAWRLTGSRAEAEDLAQDICVALPGKLAGYQRRARFTTWLHAVVVNAARDRLRRNATRARAATGWGDWETARRADMAEEAEAGEWLMQAMAALTPDLRETVALVVGEDLTHAEAALALGLSEGTVSWRMSEVKKRLRALAEKEGA
jgi:RNA polymerase sigma-70 factor (ECF subfamily)